MDLLPIDTELTYHGMPCDGKDWYSHSQNFIEPARHTVCLQVFALLESGEDATALDARGRPPYMVAANKEVRDIFRRYVASVGTSLTWDVETAGIPSALTHEKEAQQAAKQVSLSSLCQCSVPAAILIQSSGST